MLEIKVKHKFSKFSMFEEGEDEIKKQLKLWKLKNKTIKNHKTHLKIFMLNF